MGLWDKIKNEIIDIIEWTDDTNNTMVEVSATPKRNQKTGTTDRAES